MTVGSTILIIDDEPNLSRSLGLILQRAGYAITVAANAAQALQCLQAGAFDLAFLDIKLPDMSGIELLPIIRNSYPDMPVLILTAHATLETAIEAVRNGARDYLLKPIDPEDILELTANIIREQKSPRRRREIAEQMQGLLAELRTMDGSETSAEPPQKNNPPTNPARYLRCGPLILDQHTHTVQLNESSLSIPPSTFDYLVTLVRHSPEPVTYEKLVSESQGYQNLTRIEAKEITRWQVHELRKLLEASSGDPKMIITVRDVGYRLVV